jgi:hypothetical protein
MQVYTVLAGENDSVLSILKQAQSLSYNKDLIDIVRTFGSYIGNYLSDYLGGYLEDGAGVPRLCWHCDKPLVTEEVKQLFGTLELFQTAFADLENELSNPRCCAGVASLLANLDSGLSQCVTLFLDWFEQIYKGPDGASPIDFEQIKAVVDEVELAVRRCIGKTIYFVENNDNRCCLSGALEPYLSGVCETISSLEMALGGAAALPAYSCVEDIPCHTHSIANTISQFWPRFIEIVQELVGAHSGWFTVPQPAQITQPPQKYLFDATPATIASLYKIMDTLQQLAPFILDTSKCLFMLGDYLQGELPAQICSSCDAALISSEIKLIAGNLGKTLTSILSLLDFFEAAKAQADMRSFYVLLLRGVPSLSVVDETRHVIYRNCKNNGLIITLDEALQIEEPLCYPYFSYNNEQVLWDKEGNIQNPDLAGCNINDFAPIKTTEYIDEAGRTAELAKVYLNNIREAFSKSSVYPAGW